MYSPSAFREDRPEIQHALIRAHPLGLLISAGPGGLMANPIPFALEPTEGVVVLRAHLARANPQLAELAAVAECLVVFQGPQDYVTPSWYETKRETGKVVPTWNYATVHAWGRPTLHDDPHWLRGQLDQVTTMMERARRSPWAVDDAPADYVAGQIKGIVGLTVAVRRMEGKWKVSQNRPPPDRAGVVRGLREGGSDAMADLVEERG